MRIANSSLVARISAFSFCFTLRALRGEVNFCALRGKACFLLISDL